MKEDILEAKDIGEAVSMMEPLLISVGSKHRGVLNDLALDLATFAARFRGSLPKHIEHSLANLVRAMNCYYSNLIEGHDTHPVDIERALNDDYSTNAKQRNLQLEAKAHITVQRWIDEGGLKDRATSPEGLCEIHRRFCELLPEELLWVEEPGTGERIRVVPGELRQRDVKVGKHIAISPGALPRFLERFESAYSGIGKTEAILACAAAHHRLLWLHPFLDGNGRVARLMSYAILLDLLDAGGIWSIARGLARNESEYKRQLAACDQPRRGDLDGRGNLSEEALAGFTRFFLETCIDQVKFMEELVAPEKLRGRILSWAEGEIRADSLPPQSAKILERILYQGELPRSEVAPMFGVGTRQARRYIEPLTELGALTSKSMRDPYYLAFPAKLASQWMPGLFPEHKT
ncbi:MAG: Fic family protein [Gammaproteobacteria bacterium]